MHVASRLETIATDKRLPEDVSVELVRIARWLTMAGIENVPDGPPKPGGKPTLVKAKASE